MLQCNTDYQFKFLMTVIDDAYGWCICVREAALAWCIGENVLPSHMSRNNSWLCSTDAANSARPCCRNCLCRDIMSSMPVVHGARDGPRGLFFAALPCQDGHAGSGEPGVRQAFERFAHERDLQI
jgi:hypothetical protein